jgi:hypothetical protein
MSEHGPGQHHWYAGGDHPQPGPVASGWYPGTPVQPGRGPAAPPWPGQPVPPPPTGRAALVPALLASAVVAAGLVVAVVLGALVVSASADDLGRAIGESSAGAVAGQLASDEGYGWSAYPPEDLAPVEQSAPVAPGDLGEDPTLDGYADACFDGDLQSCDDLYSDSEPLSDYEHYALTCGGRVKAFDVYLCADLD